MGGEFKRRGPNGQGSSTVQSTMLQRSGKPNRPSLYPYVMAWLVELANGKTSHLYVLLQDVQSSPNLEV